MKISFSPFTSINRIEVFLVLLAFTCRQAHAQIPHATEQVINEGDSPAVIAEKAAKVLSRANQTDWMRLERTFFLHFGVNTFNEVKRVTPRRFSVMSDRIHAVAGAATAAADREAARSVRRWAMLLKNS